MPVDLPVERAVVPIVRAKKEQPILEVLGTGFFVGNDSALHVITAKHAIEASPLAADESYAIVFRHTNGAVSIRAFTRYSLALDFDLAACVVERDNYPDAIPLAISREDAAINDDVISFEYSATRIERKAGGGVHVSIEPHAHKGNIVRYFDSTFPEKVLTRSLLTSFPALQGASGAPIVMGARSKNRFLVVGMTVANYERHLLPAQVVKIKDGEEYEESISYFLPYGKALARSVVVECLVGMHVPFSYGEAIPDSGSLLHRMYKAFLYLLGREDNR